MTRLKEPAPTTSVSRRDLAALKRIAKIATANRETDSSAVEALAMLRAGVVTSSVALDLGGGSRFLVLRHDHGELTINLASPF